MKGKKLSCVWLFVTPWTAAYQAPPSMGFSRQEYWSGLPLPSRVTLLQSLIIYRTIHLIDCFKSSHHFRWRLSHILGDTRIIVLWNKQNTNGVVNNISGIKSKYFSHEPPTPVFFLRLSRLGNGSLRAEIWFFMWFKCVTLKDLSGTKIQHSVWIIAQISPWDAIRCQGSCSCVALPFSS